MHLNIAHVEESAKEAGAVGLGIIAGNVGMKMIKKDTLPVNAGIALAGIIGSTMTKHKHLQMGLLGVAIFGALKVASHAVAAAGSGGGIVPMYGVEEMNGFIPENLKAKIRGFLPTIGGIEDEEIFRQIKGTSYEDLRGGYADLTGDDNMGALDVSHEEVNGMGDAGYMI